jgi:uncharacterized DUF497 family protein
VVTGVYTILRFEWDEAKRRENIRKHGIDFIDAALVFDGPTIEKADTRKTYGEPRWQALGTSGDLMLVVVYTMRGNQRRIISAWKVNEDGAKRYAGLLTR